MEFSRTPVRIFLWLLTVLQLMSSLRILVVTIDHRELDADLRNASHQSLSAVINYNYAKLHGYDYIYYHPFINETEVRIKYELNQKLTISQSQRQDEMDESSSFERPGGRKRRRQPSTAFHDEVPTSFHPGLKEFRGSSWCRLPTLWHLAKQYNGKYDALFVIDSDLVISAVHQNTTIEEKLVEWQKQPDSITWGPKDLNRAGVIFFPNSPFGNWEPATGIMIVRPSLMVADMMKEWWDFEWPEKAFTLMHDQDVLWRVYQWVPQTVFVLNQQNTAMVNEKQFPVDMSIDEWCLRKSWICHVSHSWGKERNKIFHRILHSEVVHHSTKFPLQSDVGAFFKETIASIRAQEVQFDVVKVAEEMETNGGIRKKIGNHISQQSEVYQPVVAGVATNTAASAPSPVAPTSKITTMPSKEAADPEERNNEFHNLNPSKVEEPTQDAWASFKQGMRRFVERMAKVKRISEAAGPKKSFAGLLYHNMTMGIITQERFESLFQLLVNN